MAEKAENAENATVALDASTRLAVERTRLAHDRTAMAWLRTAISLITFGYGFYKVIDAAQTSATTHHALISHRQFGLVMIAVGLLALLLGTYEHWQGTKQLQAEYPSVASRSSHVRVLSSFVALLGLLAILALLFRV